MSNTYETIHFWEAGFIAVPTMLIPFIFKEVASSLKPTKKGKYVL